jgi:carboxypeptidase Q
MHVDPPRHISVLFLLLVSGLFGLSARARQSDGPESIEQAYRTVADQIIDAALTDSFAYERLGYLVDTFGPRISGSENLENAIDWIEAEMKSDELENVHTESVMVPRWVRGKETLKMIEPRFSEMQILGLGGTIGTPPEGLTAEVVVVNSFDDLEAHAVEVRGKIVLYNVAFTSYGKTVRYRTTGAVKASRAGAIASLVRTVGSASLYTPHTGASRYVDEVRPIPHAAVTVEDAMMMQRMQDRGQKIVVRLNLDDITLPDSPSRNVMGEIIGSVYPDEVIVMGGHIDSWDVGQGAVDDGGGVVAAWQAVRLMKQLGLRPKRTVRVVGWTNEENGGRGGAGYRDAHIDEVTNHILGIESDGGVFKPTGFGFTGSDEAFEVITEIGHLLDRLDSGTITRGGGGADIGPMMREGMPGMGLRVDGSKYFWYHHSNADTLDKLDPHEVGLSVAAMAVMAYVVADMDQTLPR